jgi:hypothetical protein
MERISDVVQRFIHSGIRFGHSHAHCDAKLMPDGIDTKNKLRNKRIEAVLLSEPIESQKNDENIAARLPPASAGFPPRRACAEPVDPTTCLMNVPEKIRNRGHL